MLFHYAPILPLAMYMSRRMQDFDSGGFLKIYLIIQAVIAAVSYFTETAKIIDHWMINLFWSVEFILWALFYGKSLLHAKICKKVTYTSLYIFLAIMTYELFIKMDLLKSNDNVRTVASLFLILLSILYFYQLLQKLSPIPLKNNPGFWINSAVFFYFCASFIFGIFSRHILWGPQQEALFIFQFILIFSIIYNLILTYALWNLPMKK